MGLTDDTQRTPDFLRVLVVDDDPGVRLLLAAHFESAGQYVLACPSVPAAMAALREQSFDLIITDVVMAGMDGFELLRLVRESANPVGVVMITGYPETHAMTAALGAGADGYLAKPFSLAKLDAAAERAYQNALERAHAGGWGEDGALR